MNDNKESFLEYKKSLSRKVMLIVFGLIALILVVVLSCSAGTGVGFFDTFRIIIDHIAGVEYPPRSPEWWDDYYIWNNVMPKILGAIVCGAGLAIGGAVMQSMMNNPLADAYTTGISSGAALGAVSAILMGFTFSSISGEFGIISNAFIGALIPAFIVIAISSRISTSPATIILIGTAISYFFNSIITLMMMSVDPDSMQDAFLWQIGSLARIDWSDLPLMILVVTASSIAVCLVSSKLNLMMMGEDSAKSMGLDVSKFRILCLILISVLIASILSFTGIIGFVGLISPHIARYIIGGDNRYVIPYAMIVGALMLSAADALSRILSTSVEIPIGVVMGFIGAPIFLYLVIRNKSRREIF